VARVSRGMDREESTKTSALDCGGVRFRTLLSIHSPAEGRRHPRRSLCSLCPLCGNAVSSAVKHRHFRCELTPQSLARSRSGRPWRG